MKPKIRIIGCGRDEKIMSQASVAIELSGYETVICSSLANLDGNENHQPIYYLLWLSKNSLNEVVNAARLLNVSDDICINLFSEPIPLTKEQKDVVGRNHTIFTELNPEGWVEDLTTLLSSLPLKPSVKKNRDSITPIVNESQSTIDDTQSNTDSDTTTLILSPGKGILLLIGCAIAGLLLINIFELRTKDLTSYVILTLMIILNFRICKAMNNWMKQNGKTGIALIAISLGIISTLFIVFIILSALIKVFS